MFATRTPAEVAEVCSQVKVIEIPPNRIPTECDVITPEMLPLAPVTAEEIDRIVSAVPGGAANVQDIYPLAPFQEGILSRRLTGSESDPYLLRGLYSFDSRERLESYLESMQAVIDRHDILRTGLVWEGLSEPMQVVWRKAVLPVEEVVLEAGAGEMAEQLRARYSPRSYRMDVRHAPLVRVAIAHDEEEGRWLMLNLLHHLAGDYLTMEVIQQEIEVYLLGEGNQLPRPLPLRNLVGQARLGMSREEHEEYFRPLLADVEEPTAPFGLLNVRGDGTRIDQATMKVNAALSRRIRERARELGVSPASLCHVAWAQVVARTSGREDVVFGTAFGRMRGAEGSDRVMGPFINTLPVRIRAGEEGVKESVNEVHKQLAELLRHEHASLALAHRCSAVPTPTPLFSALLNYRHGAANSRIRSGKEEARAPEGIQELYREARTDYPLLFAVDDLGQGFRLTTQVEASIDAKRVCQYMHTALESLVEALATEPTRPLRRLEILSVLERQMFLHEWNDTAAAFQSHECMHELFEEQVERTPDTVAAVFGGSFLTYAGLNREANRLAHYLRGLGVKIESRVGICVERGLEMLVGLLAVLKAGGAYVPLDPAYPVERLQFMLEDSAPVVLLTQGNLQTLFPKLQEDLAVIDLTNILAWTGQSDRNPGRANVGLEPENLTYVIYTSGSTGAPKGVMVEHRQLSNYLLWSDEAYYRQEGSGSPAVHSIGFDGLITTLFGPIIVGQTLTLPANGHEMESIAGLCLSDGSPYTLVKLTPSHLKLLNRMIPSEGKKAPTRALMIGGEALIPADVSFWQRRFPGIRLINHFGPTEATVGCCTLEIATSVAESSSIPIGRPTANTRIYILDKQGQPSPVGVAGELYIGGRQVARGYLGRPELTADRFVVDPHATEQEARMYRTGDMGRWLADGKIEFLGRNDYQVKIRGYRIELEEIERHLASHEAIQDAVVLACEDTAGDKRLVAYYTCREGSEAGADAVSARTLRGYLKERLPDYMVPTAYVRLEKLPVTANGKLDRKGLGQIEVVLTQFAAIREPFIREDLPSDERWVPNTTNVDEGGPPLDQLTHFLRDKLPEHLIPSAYIRLEDLPLAPSGKVDRRALLNSKALPVTDGTFVAPRTEVERMLAEVWSEALQVDSPGVNDDFYVLGGHSLAAARMMPMIHAVFGVQIHMHTLLESLTISQLALKIESVLRTAGPAGVLKITQAPQRKALPLSSAQQRMWLSEQMNPGGANWNLPVGLRVRGALAIYALEQALNEIARRHHSLRTIYELADGQVVQTISPTVAVPFQTIDLEGLGEGVNEAEAIRAGQLEAECSFDLRKAPLLRLKQIKLGGDYCLLLITLHHITFDEWSRDIMEAELMALYRTLLQGAPSPLQELALQYVDFAYCQRHWMETQLLEQQRSYWRGQLSAAPAAIDLVGGRKSPASSLEGAFYHWSLSLPVAQSIKILANLEAATLFMAMLALFKAFLYRKTGHTDIIIGTDLANRSRPGTELLIGFFVNAVALRTKLMGSASFRQILRKVRLTALEAYANQDLPYDEVLKELPPQRARAPLFNAFLLFQNPNEADFELEGLEVARVRLENRVALRDLSLVLRDTSEGIDCWWNYKTALFDQDEIKAWTASFRTLTESVIGNPDLPLGELEFHAAEEEARRNAETRQREVRSFNQFKAVKRRPVF
jgi:amino acid adenylation domain-containing protein